MSIRKRQQMHSWLDPKWPLVWIFSLGFLAYAQILWFGLTGWDDGTLLENIDRLPGGLSGLMQAFRSNAFVSSSGAYYRPALIVSFIADSWFGAAGSSINHLTNIALHLTACGVLYFVLMELGARRVSAFVFSLLFALHPALAPAVAWIPGRNDSLLGACALVSFLFFARYVESRDKVHAFWHLLFFAFALFTKETGLALLLIFPAYLLLAARKKINHPGFGILAFFWLLTTSVWGVLRAQAVTHVSYLTAGGMLHGVWINMPGLLQYLGKAVFPFNLSVIPIMRNTSMVWGIAAVAALTAALAFSPARRMRRVVFGSLFFLAFLIPSMTTGGATQSAALVQLEHRLYLPMVGLILVVMETDLGRRWSADSIFTRATVIPVLLVFAVLTVLHSRDFRSEASFWENALQNSPGASFVHVHFAQNLTQYGRQEEAIAEYEKALALNPFELAALINYANIAYARAEYDKAESLLARALSEESVSPEARAGMLATLERIRDNRKYNAGKKRER